MVLPDEDKYSQTRSEMLDQLAYMLGGRAAEEIVFHDPTTGAGKRHREGHLAGPRDGHPVRHDRAPRCHQARRDPGRAVPGPRHGPLAQHYSEDVAATVDDETKKLLATAHQEAFDILEENRDVLDSLVLALMEKETLDKAQIAGSSSRCAASRCVRLDRLAHPQGLADPAGGDPGEGPRRGGQGPVREEEQGAVVIGPGSGGDLHGGTPGAGGQPPTPGSNGNGATPAGTAEPRHDDRQDGCGPGRHRTLDQDRATAAVRELLYAIGEDPDREGLQDTPARVARAWAELTVGLHQEPEDVLTTVFDLGHDDMVLVRDIELWSMCEHHLVPFTGVAHVGYIPNDDGKITGLSKLARTVDVFAKRPQVQERLTTQVADAVVRILEPRGVIVVIEAEHLCMTMRGVRKAGARTITSAVRGVMHQPATRAEAMSFINATR